ncbi:MAG: lipopolysaccharide biosynthesis protein RfbH [Candidatus Pacearchaeota archaeon]
MNKREEQLRKEIFEKIDEIYKLRKENEKFIPGITKINYAGRVYDENEIKSLVNSSIDFWLTLGPECKKFEKQMEDYLGMKRFIVCNSGSSANLLAIAALCSNIIDNPMKPGDEVITVAAGFPTTVAPIVQYNLIPVFVDIELETYNINPELIENAISSRTRAIFFAHSLGNPANMDKIMKIAKKYNLYVIEDNCDALDSKYNGKMTGTFGDISTYSFYCAHHITMGEGGGIATNNNNIAKAIISLRDWGRDCYCQPGEKNSNGFCGKRFNHKFPNLPENYDHKYVYSNIGYNLKLLDLQCAIGNVQIKKLPEFSRKRKENFRIIYESLKKYEKFIILPKWYEESEPSWFCFPITIKDSAPFKRKEIVEFIEKNNIETRMFFGGNLLKQPGFEKINCRIASELTNTNIILERTFFIGIYPGITKEMMDYIIEILNKFFSKYK